MNTSHPRPGVTVVIATRGRPELLRRAARSVLTQDLDGDIELIVVHDRCAPDPLTELTDLLDDSRRLVTVTNSRSPGLAGGRNTGIGRARHGLIAFCDDDDEWVPSKLSDQLRRWADAPDAVMVTCGIRVVTGPREVLRSPRARTTHQDLLHSRIGEIHPSSFLMRRSDLLGDGQVDETIPFSYGEDYDLLLRLTEHGDIVSAPGPLVLVHWDRNSYFTGRWEAMAGGLGHLLHVHPTLLADADNAARMSGQLAFAHAALGDRPAARHWVRRALDRRRTEPRAWLALLTMTHLATPRLITTALTARGRGI